MNIGNAVRLLRKEKGLTQDDLASMTGITQAAVSMIERNEQRPGVDTMQNICFALGIPEAMIYFYAMEDTDVAPGKATEFSIIQPIIKNLVHQLL